MQKEKTKSVFDNFTRKYALSKTLRFELKPVGKTEQFLKDNKIIEKDKTIDDSYNHAKFYFDTLHQRFIDVALDIDKTKSLQFAKFADFLEKNNSCLLTKRKLFKEARTKKDARRVDFLQKEINNIEQEIANERKRLYSAIRVLFDKEAEEWKEKYQGKVLENGERIKFSKSDIKQKGTSFLTAAGILQILKYEFPESKETEFQKMGWPSLYVEEQENPGKKRYIFDSFEKFTGYLSKFQQTRDNLYAGDGTSTAVATRIISNFEIFLADVKTFNEKYKTNHKEIGFNETHIFGIEHYRFCLFQKGIEALNQEQNSDTSYNKIIGRINQKIKEYREKITSEAKQKKDKNFNKSDYPLFKTLDKQILGKVEKEKQLIEEVGDKEKENQIFLEKFREFIDINKERFIEAKKFMTKFFNDEFMVAYDSVYVKSATINTISRRWFAEGYGRDFELFLPQKSKKKDEKDEPKVKQFVTLSDIKNAIEQLEGKLFKQTYYDEKVVAAEGKLWEQFLMIWKYEFDSLFLGIKRKDGSIALIGYDESLGKAKKLESFSCKLEEIPVVKNYADASLRVFQLMKYLAIDERDKGKITGQLNTDFYAQLDEYAKDFEFIKYYNAFRNFVSKKPFNENKIKLNFENGALLKGFDENKEYDYMGVLLLKEGKYYLGIMHKGSRNLFDQISSLNKGSTGSYRKMVYKQIADASKDVPRLLLTSGKAQKAFKPSKEVLRIKKTETFKRQNKNFSLQDLRMLIDYYKTFIPKYSNWDCYDFKFKETSEYQNIKEFTDDVQRYGYKISFVGVSDEHIEEAVNDGKLYLLEITNKDLSNTKDGSKALHTLYFEHLLEKNNLSDAVLKLSGMAEIFHRQASIEKKEKIITQKNRRLLEKGERAFKLRRYTDQKIMLHISTVLNVGNGDMSPKQFNKLLNQFLVDTISDINIIGIDRGEKHLVYYSVVNKEGEILDQGSLNTINGVNYHQKLVEREKERLANRQSWEPVAKIKDLKKGYVSQVVRKIADLVIEHNAIVVMEDLNMRFKQIRGGIERSVYQQLEKQLIDKFGYLVFKDRSPQKSGGVLKGYQLSAPFVSFEKMGKQTGIIFYTQADYTSITDPLTGFRKNTYISNSASQEKVRDALQKFKAIGWDDEEQSYFFRYNPIDFVDEKNKGNILSREWTVYARAPRIRREKDIDGYWGYEPIDINRKLKELFKLWNFDNLEVEDIKEEISRKEASGELRGKREFDGKEKNFYESFIYFFNLILQLRNSFSLQMRVKDGKAKITEEGVDFIASPVKPFFTTAAVRGEKVLSNANFINFEKRIIAKDKKHILEEFNGDANGAYNIARKGIIILQKIKEKADNPDLFISKLEWDKFVQK